MKSSAALSTGICLSSGDRIIQSGQSPIGAEPWSAFNMFSVMYPRSGCEAVDEPWRQLQP